MHDIPVTSTGLKPIFVATCEPIPAERMIPAVSGR